MLRSMTAFARAASLARKGGWAVEIRSLNQRYFEFSLKLPQGFTALEGRIRDLIQAKIRRGKVTVLIQQDSEAKKEKAFASVDAAAFRHYKKLIERMRKMSRLSGDLSVKDFMELPGVLTMEKPEEDAEKIWRDLRPAIEAALKKVLKAKEVEGRKLTVDIQKRLGAVGSAASRIEILSQDRSEAVYRKLSERLKDILKDSNLDAERVHREAAVLAERVDITEELVRLKSHLALMQKCFHKDAEVGRELDFICQELHREINTITSKAQLFEISKEVIFAKGEVEKIREQVQNIE